MAMTSRQCKLRRQAIQRAQKKRAERNALVRRVIARLTTDHEPQWLKLRSGSVIRFAAETRGLH
jgi:hypothetical protein